MLTLNNGAQINYIKHILFEQAGNHGFKNRKVALLFHFLLTPFPHPRPGFAFLPPIFFNGRRDSPNLSMAVMGIFLSTCLAA